MSNIKDDVTQIFWKPAIDYANNVVPITFETDEEVDAVQAVWNKVHKAYGEAAKNVIEFIFNNYDVKELEKPRLPETPEEIESRLRRDFEYHDMCARATLHPGKSIPEVKTIHMMKRIEEVYEWMNGILNNEKFTNDEITRRYVINRLQNKLENGIVQCDETNNPPEVIDQNILIVKVMWNADYSKTWDVSYCIMVFGEKSAVEKYQQQAFLDNESFKFIEKGL